MVARLFGVPPHFFRSGAGGEVLATGCHQQARKAQVLLPCLPQPLLDLDRLRLAGLDFQRLLEINPGLITTFQCLIG